MRPLGGANLPELGLTFQLLQQLSDPAGSLDAVKIEPLGGFPSADGHPDDVPDGRILRFLLFPEVNRGPDLLGAHLHPLAPYPDQRSLHSRQFLQLPEGELFPAEGDLPIELYNRLQGQAAPSLHLRALHFGLHGQAGPRTLARPPRGKHHAVPRLFQGDGLFGQELVGPGSVERESRRPRIFKAGGYGRTYAGGLPQRGEQELTHIRAVSRAVSIERGYSAAPGLPGLFHRYEQARVVVWLEQIANVPSVIGDAIFLPVDSLGVSRFFKTEAESKR